MSPLDLDAIQARADEAEAKRARSRRNPDPIFDAGMMLAIQASSADVPALLALVREQAAKLDLIANQVNATEELCRMNGRDPELASVPAVAIRHALEARA